MTNPYLGFIELASGQSQPEVTVNFADRMIARAIAGEVEIDFESDADYELEASNPPVSTDEWAAATIRMTDTGNVLTTARSVIYPDLDTLFTDDGVRPRLRFEFVNDTAQSLTIKGSGGVGVTVESGSKALVRYNGQDVEEVAAASGGGGGSPQPRVIQVAASQYGQPVESGAAAAYLRAPYAMKVTEVRASLAKANTSGDIEVDIRVGGTSILSDPIVIDEGQKTSTTSSSPVVIDSGNDEIGDDDEILIDIDAPTSADAESLIVTIIGTAL